MLYALVVVRHLGCQFRYTFTRHLRYSKLRVRYSIDIISWELVIMFMIVKHMDMIPLKVIWTWASHYVVTLTHFFCVILQVDKVSKKACEGVNKLTKGSLDEKELICVSYYVLLLLNSELVVYSWIMHILFDLGCLVITYSTMV